MRGGIASGKTALLRTLEEHAQSTGAIVLRASGAPNEQSLSFGVVEQLFSSSTPPPGAAEILDRLSGLDTTTAGSAVSGASTRSEARAAHDICVALLELSRSAPLVISVDDHQHADSASLRVLRSLQHRIGTSRATLLLSQDAGPPSELVAEALRQPYSRQVMLAPLSPSGVGELLARRIDPAVALREATGSHLVTGGNPLLTHALIEDALSASDEGQPSELVTPVVGEAFTRAVLACLHRGGPLLLRAAKAIAVLGEFAAPAFLARFLDVRPSVVGGAMGALELAGLTTDAQFRYHGTRAVVLDLLTPEERSSLNLRAAELLHHDGVAPSDLVGYLLAAGEVDQPWAAEVLHLAADQALAHTEQALSLGHTSQAVQYLELASRSCGDERERAMLTARLAWVQWTASPAAAIRHHGPLQTAMEKGLLDDREVMRLARSLAWHGRPKEAVRALESLGAPTVVDGARDQDERNLTRKWLALWHPQIYADVKDTAAMSGPASVHAVPRQAQAVALTRAAGDAETVERAEQVLQRVRVRDTPLASVTNALHELLVAEQFPRVMYWCKELLKKAESANAPAWRAVLLDTRAAVSLRLGHLADAERDACAALSSLSPRSWGVAIGSPLAHAVLATTMMGHFEKAGSLLEEMVPAAMMGTRYGLQYLSARGHFSLATDRPHAALEDFEAVGELAVRWKVDHPVALPWRGDVARALVQIGQRERARDLVREQIRMIGPSSPRMRGISLGVLASVSDLKQRRLSMLGEAVELLQAADDRYQLALVFVELGQVWQILGELDRARLIRRRALQLAKSCHAEQLHSQLVANHEALSSNAAPASPGQWDEGEGMEVLSEAERRVAALAALGRTNREVGQKLHITVSTVEQHLTRIYRKLNIKRRADLPVSLPVDFAQITDTA